MNSFQFRKHDVKSINSSSNNSFAYITHKDEN